MPVFTDHDIFEQESDIIHFSSSDTNKILHPEYITGDIIKFPDVGDEKYIVIGYGAFNANGKYSEKELTNIATKGGVLNVLDGGFLGPVSAKKLVTLKEGQGNCLFGYYDKNKRLIPEGSTVNHGNETLVLGLYCYSMVPYNPKNLKIVMDFKKSKDEGTDINYFEKFDSSNRNQIIEYLPISSPLNVEKISKQSKIEDSVIIEEDLSDFTEDQVVYLQMMNDFKDYVKTQFRQKNKETI